MNNKQTISLMHSAIDELYHYGILGMKWGVRRYQPYPKGYSGDGKFVGEKTHAELYKDSAKKAAKAARSYDRYLRKRRRQFPKLDELDKWTAEGDAAYARFKDELAKSGIYKVFRDNEYAEKHIIDPLRESSNTMADIYADPNSWKSGKFRKGHADPEPSEFRTEELAKKYAAARAVKGEAIDTLNSYVVETSQDIMKRFGGKLLSTIKPDETRRAASLIREQLKFSVTNELPYIDEYTGRKVVPTN